MHSVIIISLLILINVYLIFAMPSLIMNQDDELQNYNDMANHPLTNRLQISPWIHKRNPALCDYRFQLRPLPFTSSLCAYGHNKDDAHQVHLFKYG
ncbi:unnamed protein product [Rotaria sp. Silwood1]|nr:unnamed protein product [Rotaria sp. Silwood1]CAF3663881.1 unnamed protein product [Rotaria sp. Silwood1]CAF4670371.1 unnamed protein product [Rotaria sp. Silwood1]CAF4691117.1 unnamed protein product [Rotaria sp. Silwood1]CAF4795422.1 unnamed protein product [Rotaria sp. Silwood1]